MSWRKNANIGVKKDQFIHVCKWHKPGLGSRGRVEMEYDMVRLHAIGSGISECTSCLIMVALATLPYENQTKVEPVI